MTPSALSFVRLSLVKAGVIGVEILVVQVVLDHAHTFPEALEVDDLALTKEADGITDVGVIAEAQDVVVGGAGLLLCPHVLGDVGDGVALGLEIGRGEGHSCGGNGVDPGGVIHEIGIKTGLLDLLHGEVAGKLVHDGADHFQMGQLLRADVRESADNVLVGHGIPLGEITQGSPQFTVGAAELGDDQLCQGGVGILDIHGVLQFFLV